MSQSTAKPAYRRLLGIVPEHRLIAGRHLTKQHNGMIYKTQWLEERDQRDTLINRYRTWTNQSMLPPYRMQQGWERFSTSGELLDREVRYTRSNAIEQHH